MAQVRRRTEVEGKKFKVYLRNWAESLIVWADRGPLWLFGFPVLAVNLIPCFILGEGSVFPIHDQLDETLFVYVLNAKYLGAGTPIFRELLGGINVSGMQPSAVLFVPLYRLLPAFAAFLVQWAIVVAVAFFGMYFCVKEITDSSILAVASAVLFCMLPHMPVYGLSSAGVPLLLCCVLWLFRRKRVVLSFGLILLFGLTTHLVLIGYVVLGLWALALLWTVFRKKRLPRKKEWLPWCGFGGLTVTYIAVNRSLFLEFFLGNGSYISHREEMVNQSLVFWETVGSVFLNSSQHAESHHQYLIIPILVMLLVGGLLYRRMEQRIRARYLTALGGLVLLALIAVFYGVCNWQPVVDWQNSIHGFLHYFQAERFYWLYPAGWYLEFVLCFSLWWNGAEGKEGSLGSWIQSSLLKLLVLAAVLLPTWQEVKEASYLYQNVNQINNGSGVTGYISWESFYAEELMQELEEAISRDMATYRVAHLGMSPAPALMHGFYTVDGYSNNYPLEYKQRFRQVIAREIEKNEAVRMYFDDWGSRCYLFNNASGTVWMLGKADKIVYQELDFDMEALKDLGCDYLFSCGVIMNADELGLSFIGYYETESSYWGVWLYEL